MQISQIYEKYSIPINLQIHMYRVAGVGRIICDRLSGVQVDADLIVKTLLLHDMGNIVKFDLSKPTFLVDSDQKKVDKLKSLQSEFIKKYGTNADEATIIILEELGVNPKIIDLCKNSHGADIAKMEGVDNWEKVIAYYSDMRVGPIGVMPLNDRFEDLAVRYSQNKENIAKYRQKGQEIERELQKVTGIDLNYIDTYRADRLRDELNSIRI